MTQSIGMTQSKRVIEAEEDAEAIKRSLDDQFTSETKDEAGPSTPGNNRKLVEGILRGYANKLLHEPLVQVRQFANDDDSYIRLDTVRRLFDLSNGADGSTKRE